MRTTHHLLVGFGARGNGGMCVCVEYTERKETSTVKRFVGSKVMRRRSKSKASKGADGYRSESDLRHVDDPRRLDRTRVNQN